MRPEILPCPRLGYYHLPAEQRGGVELYRREFWESHRDYLEREARTQWYWRRVYGDWYRVVSSRAPATSPWLDVGCGAGWFVRYLRSRGVAAYGLDPWEGSPAEYRGDFLEVEVGLSPRVISMINVLEHVPDPEAFLARAWDLLPPGGLLLAQVPHEFNPLQKRLVAREGPFFVHPVHVSYWSAETFTSLLVLQGFAPLEWGVTFPMELFALAGLNYVRHPRLGPFCHFVRMLIEVPAPLRRLTRRLWKRWGVGRDLWVVARKVEAAPLFRTHPCRR